MKYYDSDVSAAGIMVFSALIGIFCYTMVTLLLDWMPKNSEHVITVSSTAASPVVRAPASAPP